MWQDVLACVRLCKAKETSDSAFNFTPDTFFVDAYLTFPYAKFQNSKSSYFEKYISGSISLIDAITRTVPHGFN